MSSRTRIIENSKKPAIGGGRTYSVPCGLSMSSRIARDASPSSDVRASASGMLQMRAARPRSTGRIGSRATRPASRSSEQQGQDPVQQVATAARPAGTG